MKHNENNCAIVFEEEDFDRFLLKLKAQPEISIIHDVLTHTWGQRVIWFYDPDGHIIEVGEMLESVVTRFVSTGMSIEDIAQKMDMSVENVRRFAMKL